MQIFKGILRVIRFNASRKGLVDSGVLCGVEEFRKGLRSVFEDGKIGK